MNNVGCFDVAKYLLWASFGIFMGVVSFKDSPLFGLLCVLVGLALLGFLVFCVLAQSSSSPERGTTARSGNDAASQVVSNPPPISPPPHAKELPVGDLERRIKQQYEAKLEAHRQEWQKGMRDQEASVRASLRTEYEQRLRAERDSIRHAAEASFARLQKEWESERLRQAKVPSNRKMTRADHEKILGLAIPYTKQEIHTQYRQRAARCHPDKVAQLDTELQEVAERLMRELNVARDYLLANL